MVIVQDVNAASIFLGGGGVGVHQFYLSSVNNTENGANNHEEECTGDCAEILERKKNIRTENKHRNTKTKKVLTTTSMTLFRAIDAKQPSKLSTIPAPEPAKNVPQD